MRNLIGFVIVFAFILGGGYGVFGAHENGAWPILVIGIAALVALLWRRT